MSRCPRCNNRTTSCYCNPAHNLGRSDNDNSGQIGIDITSGDLTIGLGGGLTMDLSDGDLGMSLGGGLSMDF